MRNLLTIISSLVALASTAQQPIKATSSADRMQSEKNRQALVNASFVNGLPFTGIGPTVMSGRVTDLDVNPENPIEFYVAYASGGLWYTRNNGQSFTPVSDNLPHTFMGDVTVNWKAGIIWLGTGEANAQRSSYAGTGVYKSTDKGRNWTWCGLPETHHIGKIELHPTNPEIAWVAATGHLYTNNRERGVFRTQDGGKTWQHTLYVNDSTGAIEVLVDPSNPDIVYASTWEKTRKAWNFVECGPGSGIYKSTDGGKNWQRINTASSGFPAGKHVGRIGLDLAVKEPNTLYAVVDNQEERKQEAGSRKQEGYEVKDFVGLDVKKFMTLDEKMLDAFLKAQRIERETAASLKDKVRSGKFKPSVLADYFSEDSKSLLEPPVTIKGAEVYKSRDGGKTWQKTHDKPIDNMFYTYGYVFARIWISPVNPDKIAIIGVPLLLSEDGGKTFKRIDKENVHVDHHAFWFNPKNDEHIVNGNDGGVNISYDNGATWFKANTPAVGQFYAITVDQSTPYRVFGGLQDNGVWYGPSNYTFNYNWTADGEYPYKGIGGGDGMQVQVDPRDNATFYTGSQFGYYFRGNTSKRPDYTSIRPNHRLGDKPLRFNWQTPIHLSRHHPDIIYIGANKVYRSMKKGEEMQAISHDLTNGYVAGDVPYGTITTLTESPLRFGLLYAGTDDGKVHVTKDGGVNWTEITGKLPPKRWISRVVASAHDEARVYVSVSGYRYDELVPYLYASEDHGKTWQALGRNLPLEPINVVREDAANENILYVGTDNGIYISFDRGQEFQAWDNGLPRVPVHDIAIQERDKEIVLGTHGRSLYKAGIDLVQQLTITTIQKPFAFLETKAASPAQQSGRRRRTVNGTATIPLAFYLQHPEKLSVELLSTAGKSLFRDTIDAVKGINSIQVEPVIDSANQQELMTEWKKTKPSDEKTYLLPPGKYRIRLIQNGGMVHEKTMELENGLGARERATAGPGADPEMEEILEAYQSF